MINPTFEMHDESGGKKRKKKFSSQVDQNPNKNDKPWTKQLLQKAWTQFNLDKRNDISK